VTDRRDKLLELLETSGRRFHALLYRLTLRTDMAEELLQELMLRLLRSSGFARAESAEGYAIRAAVNLAFDWRRRRRRTAVENTNVADVELDDPLVDALSRIVQTEQRDAILTSLEKLSTAQREVVVLHYLEEESFDQIAQRVNRTPHQVRALCQKGLQRLRAIHGYPASKPLAKKRPIADEVRHESG
jgi:RNA polymerase sigma factor (sigma-70 family)